MHPPERPNYCRALVAELLGRHVAALVLRAEEAVLNGFNQEAIDLLNESRSLIGNRMVDCGFAEDGTPLGPGMAYESAIDVLGKAIWEIERAQSS